MDRQTLMHSQTLMTSQTLMGQSVPDGQTASTSVWQPAGDSLTAGVPCREACADRDRRAITSGK